MYDKTNNSQKRGILSFNMCFTDIFSFFIFKKNESGHSYAYVC